jgi:hypothetical protein
MDHGIVKNDAVKQMLITSLRRRFDMLPPTLHYHLMWLARLRNDIIDILPPEGSKFKNQRAKMIEFLDEAQLLYASAAVNNAPDNSK